MADGGSNLPDSISLLVGGLGAFFMALAAIITGALRGKWFSGGGVVQPSQQAPQIPSEQRWFFEGPLAVAVNLLRDNRNHLGRLVDIADKQTELLREIKEGIEKLPDVIEKEIEKLPSRRLRR